MTFKDKRIKALRSKLLKIDEKNQSLVDAYDHLDLSISDQLKTFLRQTRALMNFINVECKILKGDVKDF